MSPRVGITAADADEATAKGAEFLTERIDRKGEIRCHLRDPNGYPIEIGQATRMLEGVYADKPDEQQQ